MDDDAVFELPPQYIHFELDTIKGMELRRFRSYLWPFLEGENIDLDNDEDHNPRLALMKRASSTTLLRTPSLLQVPLTEESKNEQEGLQVPLRPCCCCCIGNFDS